MTLLVQIEPVEGIERSKVVVSRAQGDQIEIVLVTMPFTRHELSLRASRPGGLGVLHEQLKHLPEYNEQAFARALGCAASKSFVTVELNAEQAGQLDGYGYEAKEHTNDDGDVHYTLKMELTELIGLGVCLEEMGYYAGETPASTGEPHDARIDISQMVK